MRDPQGETFRKALALHRSGNVAEAGKLYARILAKNPGHADALHNAAVVALQLADYQEADRLFREVIRRNPAHATAHSNYGKVLKHLGRLDEALASYDRAAALKPDFVDAHYNRGILLQDMRRWSDAVESYDKALALRPDHTEARNNRGSALHDLKRLDEAIDCFDRTIAIDKTHANAYTNRAFAKLALGDYDSAWADYEWRKVRPEPLGNRFFPFPLLPSAAAARGKRVLVHHEQGLGDTIQFCRYVPLLEGADVSFAPQPALAALMKSLGAGVAIADAENPGAAFDYHAPLLSLPLAFGTRLHSVPPNVPYLFAEPERVARWRKAVGQHGFAVGINWQGSRNKVDIGRSFPVSLFAPLSRIPGVRLIGLHKGDGLEQLKSLPPGMRIELPDATFDQGPGAFLDTAALMRCCDLVITSDTATAHLAGALGVPVWVALKFVPDWRWMLDRSDSPWYPSMKLFRQPSDGDWEGVFAEIERALQALAAMPRSR